MALQIRRGLAADRTTITPAQGELLYTTDTKQLYAGDGTTPGGVLITGGGAANTGDFIFTNSAASVPVNSTLSLTAQNNTTLESKLTLSPTTTSELYAANLLKLGVSYGSGFEKYWEFNADGSIRFPDASVQSTAFTGIGNLDDIGNVSAAGAVNGEVLRFNGTNWVNSVDSVGINSVSQDSSPTLGGNLNLNSRNISGSGNIDITGTIKTGATSITNTLITTNGANLEFGSNSLSIPNILVKGSYITHRGTTSGGGVVANAVSTETSRGTLGSPTDVFAGDLLGGLAINGYQGTGFVPKAFVLGGIDTTAGTNTKPGLVTFVVNGNNGGYQEAVTIRSNRSMAVQGGVITNSVTSGTDTNLTLVATGTGRVSLDGLLWPNSDGTNGQVLTTNGSGSLSWTTVSAGSGLLSRVDQGTTTGTLADAEYGTATIVGYKGYVLFKIYVSAAAWVRIYTDPDSRTSDASRAEGVDPAPGSGVIAEFITTGAQTIVVSPGVMGWNNQAVPTTNIPIAVTNKSGAPAAITVTLTILGIEA